MGYHKLEGIKGDHARNMIFSSKRCITWLVKLTFKNVTWHKCVLDIELHIALHLLVLTCCVLIALQLQEMEEQAKQAPGSYRTHMLSRIRNYRRDLDKLFRDLVSLLYFMHEFHLGY